MGESPSETQPVHYLLGKLMEQLGPSIKQTSDSVASIQSTLNSVAHKVDTIEGSTERALSDWRGSYYLTVFICIGVGLALMYAFWQLSDVRRDLDRQRERAERCEYARHLQQD